MDVYSLNRVARSDYEQKMRSMPQVSEYDFPAAEPKNPNRQRVMQFGRAILTSLMHLVTR